MKLLSIYLFLFCALLPLSVYSRTAEEWKSRSVYQIITDRFARTNGDTQECADLNNYCGGTFKGILNNLDYIKGMGFDAIWISPVTANTPGGYHGYWTNNLYEINENFGTAEELKELVETCHEKDIWVMVDVVANHIGYVPWENGTAVYTEIVPFNDPAHYNPYLQCEKIDWKNQSEVENCWLSGLPDLNQNHPFVRQTLLDWAGDFSKTYNIDALRIDTIPHVSRAFWAEFSKASGIFTVGEILNLDLHYIASYQGAVDSVLNYALYSTLRHAFQNKGTMTAINDYYQDAYATFQDVTVLGNFVNNHDNPRFLNESAATVENFKNAIAFTICSVGIPMVYYGDEYAFSGGQDPLNRETIWEHINTDSDIYQFLKTLNTFRKNSQFYKYDQIQRVSDERLYAFSRGDTFFAFTNSEEPISKVVTSHPYSEGTQLCNILVKGDCVEVKDGEFTVELTNGKMKVYTPSQNEQEGGATATWKNIKLGLATGSVFGERGCEARV